MAGHYYTHFGNILGSNDSLRRVVPFHVHTIVGLRVTFE